MTITVDQNRDLEWFNTLLNHAEIYPTMKDDRSPAPGALSVAPLMSNYENLFLKVHADDKPVGGFILVYKGLGIYEVHTMLLPEGRGAPGIRAGRLGEEWMFRNTNALELTSYAWDTSPQTVMFAKLCGFKQAGRRPWPATVGGKTVFADYLSITLREWVRNAWGDFSLCGAIFQEELCAEMKRPLPAVDPYHNGIFGIALSMMMSGQPAKACLVHNEWAAANGFTPIEYLGQRSGWHLLKIGATAIIEIGAEWRPRLICDLTGTA